MKLWILGPNSVFLPYASKQCPMYLRYFLNTSYFSLKYFYLIKTTPLKGFLEFYVMWPAERHLFGIAQVKVDIMGFPKIYVLLQVGRFVWVTCFAQCAPYNIILWKNVRLGKEFPKELERVNVSPPMVIRVFL